MTTPEQDQPNRLAEIKAHPIDPSEPCMRAFTGRCGGDRDWLIGEVERLRSALQHHTATMIWPPAEKPLPDEGGAR